MMLVANRYSNYFCFTRILNKFNPNIKFPESAYQGDYIFTLADTIEDSI